MTASVTFGNINGHNEPAPHMSLHMEQKRAGPISVTTPTFPPCGGQDPGIKHRGSSSHDRGGEGEGEGEGVGGMEDGISEGTPPALPARYICPTVFVCAHMQSTVQNSSLCVYNLI